MLDETLRSSSDSLATALLWLLVIFLGITFGAGVYEERIVVSRWLRSTDDARPRWNAAEAVQDDTGRRFWGFVSTAPLTLLTLGNLVVAWRSQGVVHDWWLFSAVAATADRVVTFGYFIPMMVGLMRAEDSPASATRAVRWSRLNYVRLAIVLVAWLAALRTFSLLYRGHA